MKKLANTIHEGDCIQIMKNWKDNSFDHCITDPPYNMSKKKRNGMGIFISYYYGRGMGPIH